MAAVSQPMGARSGWRDNYFGAGAGSFGWNFGGAAGNRRRYRAGAGDDLPLAHGPASGAGNFVIHLVASDWAGRAPGILESRERGFARRNFMRGRNDSGRLRGQQIRRANVHAKAERIVWRIFDFVGGAAVEQGEASSRRKRRDWRRQ